jgi:hypothetical protein
MTSIANRFDLANLPSTGLQWGESIWLVASLHGAKLAIAPLIL